MPLTARRSAVFATLLAATLFAQEPIVPDVIVDRDDIRITTSCRLVVPEGRVVDDANGDGVVHVEADDVVVTMAAGSVLRGAPADRAPDAVTGTGVVVKGRARVTLRHLRLRGFKRGVFLDGCDDAVLDGLDVADGFRQRLASTPDTCRDDVDWLSPHANDRGEWAERWGAAIVVERSQRPILSDFVIRRVQNGVILASVTDGRVYDGDASWLSGWGLAMWRCSRVTVSRNAFDGCIRGYSHGVYNRGQDSAGILFFESNTQNVIAENSVTKGGDGIFGFAGRDALDGTTTSAKRRGCNDNLFLRNDLSDAAAHGLELTFSFGNVIAGNRFDRNAICGVWAGYSQDTWIFGNTFLWNGDAGYGLERGGVNIDSGARNVVVDNTFTGDRCGIHLWSAVGDAFRSTPWGAANLTTPLDRTWILANRFAFCPVPMHFRSGARVEVHRAALPMMQCGASKTEGDVVEFPFDPAGHPKPPMTSEPPLFGVRRPVGRLAKWRGRHHITMTEWGPHDPTSGPPPPPPPRRDVPIAWEIRAFPWTKHPVDDLEGWRRDAKAFDGSPWRRDRLLLRYGSGGPSELADAPDAWKKVMIGVERFGTVARGTVKLPAGRWRVTATFDDGLRLRRDGTVLLETWKHHPPATETTIFTTDREATHVFDVEHFELDGWAVLDVTLEPAP